MLYQKQLLHSCFFLMVLFSVPCSFTILPGGCILSSIKKIQVGQQSILRLGQTYDIDILGYNADIIHCDPKLKVIGGHVINNAPNGLKCVENSYAFRVMALEEGPAIMTYQVLISPDKQVTRTAHFEIVL